MRLLLPILSLAYLVNGQQKPEDRRPEIPDTGRQFPVFNGNPQSLNPLPQYPPLGDQQPQQFNPFGHQAPQYNPYSGGYYPGIQQNQGYPVQPQILYYQGGPGQPFLVNPGSNPGNFLIPQQPYDPVYRNPYPQGPVFLAGYPKPAHVPPVEKDAEEVPKNTPKQGNTQGRPEKLEKLEQLDENDTEVEKKPNPVNLGPGHRFFILNRQPLFSNYPNIPQVGQFGFHMDAALNPYFGQNRKEELKPYGSLAKVILRGRPVELQQHILPEGQLPPPQQSDGLPIVLHNQVVDNNFRTVVLAPKDSPLQSRYFEKGIPLDAEPQKEPIFDPPVYQNDYYKYSDDALDDGSVIINAKYQDTNKESVTEEEAAETEKPAESSIAQAQPGAIALAGNGGVAAAGPRGTALAGEGGLAVSSPHATAVAGPSKDEAPSTSSTTESSKKQ